MEIVQVVGRDSQGLCQRVLIELVRRKITLETAVMGKKEGKMVMILGITNLPDKGKTLYALKAIPDVISAEWLNDRVRCSWGTASISRGARGKRETCPFNGTMQPRIIFIHSHP